MKRLTRTMIVLLMMQFFLVVTGSAQSNKPQLGAKGQSAPAQNAAVNGGGTSGRISKWVGVSGANTFVLGDSGIFEDKFGKVGIGTTTPTSPLTVVGMIETTLGGLKFPDGTVQTTAAVNGLQSVFHDATLKGNGTQGSPLGVAVPLILSGTVKVTNTDTLNFSSAIIGIGPESPTGTGGTGIEGAGGRSREFGNGGQGGTGVKGFGGDSTLGLTGTGGPGVHGIGGVGKNVMGYGVWGTGGRRTGEPGPGGIGVLALGGDAHGAGFVGGAGLSAVGGEGIDGGITGPAASFLGSVDVTGNLSKGGGSFKIDHPLDPENKYLYHSFVESPDMKNIYDGNVTTDANGEAVVEMPDYFEALNRDFRYQLTVIGSFAQAMVAEKIKGNQFRIKTNAPNTEVSWQVTGIRQDAYANKNRIPVEVNKTESERGFYLHPKAFDQAEERGIEWALNPQLMQQIKQQRLEGERKHKSQE